MLTTFRRVTTVNRAHIPIVAVGAARIATIPNTRLFRRAGVVVLARGGIVDVLAALSGVASVNRTEITILTRGRRPFASTFLASILSGAGIAIITRRHSKGHGACSRFIAEVIGAGVLVRAILCLVLTEALKASVNRTRIRVCAVQNAVLALSVQTSVNRTAIAIITAFRALDSLFRGIHSEIGWNCVGLGDLLGITLWSILAKSRIGPYKARIVRRGLCHTINRRNVSYGHGGVYSRSIRRATQSILLCILLNTHRQKSLRRVVLTTNHSKYQNQQPATHLRPPMGYKTPQEKNAVPFKESQNFRGDNSSVYQGEVSHTRKSPETNRFLVRHTGDGVRP